MRSRDIYEFVSPREVILFVFNEKQAKNPHFSIRAWSRKLGYQNPSYLSEILSGKRSVSLNFGLKIADALELSLEEKIYFETLVYLSNAGSEEERQYFENLVKRLRPEETQKPIEPDSHGLIKDWYYGVVDEMTCLKDFQADPVYISKRLKGVTPQSVELAIHALLRLGSIEKGPKGKLTRPKKAFFRREERKDQPEELALRTYQKKFMEKGTLAIDEQTQGESFFRMTNIPIKARDFELFQEHIENFVQKMGKLESSRDAQEIYHLGVQFFRVTEPLPN